MYRLGEIGCAVIDRLVRTDFAQEFVVGRARGADDVRAARLGDLNGEVSDATRCRMDQDALSSLQFRGVDEGLPGGEGGQGVAAA